MIEDYETPGHITFDALYSDEVDVKTGAATAFVKNGSKLDIVAAQQSSRGKRATGGLMEEVILIDKTQLNEVIIPLMNVDRRLSDGTRDENEITNKSQIYVTTAG